VHNSVEKQALRMVSDVSGCRRLSSEKTACHLFSHSQICADPDSRPHCHELLHPIVLNLATHSHPPLRSTALLHRPLHGFRMIMPFPDYARRHHAKRIAGWLAQPGWRIKPRLILACWQQSDPIERLWGLMHREIPDKASIGGSVASGSPSTYVSFHLKIFGF